MRTRRKSIVLFGLFGVGNVGNDASLLAMLRHLREALPDTSISCICGNPAKIAEEYKIPSISLYPEGRNRNRSSGSRLAKLLYRVFLRLPAEVAVWFRTFRCLREVGLVVIPGTGILDDFGLRSASFSYGLFKWCVLAKLSGAKLLFVSIGAGPIVNRLNRLLMTSAARIADYRSYRDTVSKDFMVRIGFDAHDDPIYPDLVFSLPAPQPEENGELESGPLTVGVGVMTYYGWKSDPADGAATYQTYLRKLGEFVEWLLDQKYRVRLLVGEVTDQRAVDDLRARLASSLKDSAPSRIVSEPISSIQDLLRQVARTDLVVATRFHNVVCALMLEKPVVSLGYAEKNDVLMNEIGLAGYCQHIERFNVDRLIAQFRELVQDRQRFRQCIRSKNEQYRENLRRQFAHIVSQMA